MTLVQKTINSTEYYTDNEVYYTFHQVKLGTETLWNFACMDLGITKKIGFTSQEIKDITDLAGIGPRNPTKFLLLKNGNAIPVPYHTNGGSNLHPNDIILRPTVDPAAPKTIIPPVTGVALPSVSTASIADRLNEIENLRNMNLITDLEYHDKRSQIMAEL